MSCLRQPLGAVVSTEDTPQEELPLHLDACHSCAMREVGIDDDGSDFSEGYLHKRYRAYHAQVDGRIPPQRVVRYGLNELGGEECSLCGPDGVYKGSVPDPDCQGEDEHFRMNKVRRICDGWNMGNAPAVHGFGEECIQGSISSGTASGQMDDHSLLREMLKDFLLGLEAEVLASNCEHADSEGDPDKN